MFLSFFPRLIKKFHKFEGEKISIHHRLYEINQNNEWIA